MKMKSLKKLPAFRLLAVCLIAIPTAFALIGMNQNVQAETGHWEQTGTGTSCYAAFPGGYNTSSSLYSQYNKGSVDAYENSTEKREVTTERIGWIYWHWSWRTGATANGKYNFYIHNSSSGDESHNSYPYFADFYSTESFSEYDPDGHHDATPGLCFYHWRGNVNDGSWWWFRIPVYKQTYRTYKYVTVSDDSQLSEGSSVSKVSKKSTTGCTVSWKKCSSKKCTGYQIRYCRLSDFSGCKTKTIKGRSKTYYSLSGLCPGTTYYIQVRVYWISNGTKYYSAWSSTKTTTTSRIKGTSVSKCSSISISGCTLKWKKCGSKQCTGYQVRYCKSSDFSGCGTKSIKGRTKTSCKLSGLSSGTKYYIQIRVYWVKNGVTYYSKWSAIKKFCTKKPFATPNGTTYDCVKKGDYVYCGAEDGDIYKVNVKTNKKTKFVSSSAWAASDLSIKNNYLYYIRWYLGDYEYPISVYRTSLSSKKTYKVVNAMDYYISGNTLYYAPYTKNNNPTDDPDYDDSYIINNWAKADLAGKFCGKTNNRGSRYSGKHGSCNAKGYKLTYKYHSSSYKETAYLKKPNGKKIKLTTYYDMMGVPYWWIEDQWY